MKEQIQQLINSGIFANFQLAYAIDKFATMGIVNDMLIPEIEKLKKSDISPAFAHFSFFMMVLNDDTIELWVEHLIICVPFIKHSMCKSIATELCRKLSKQF